MAPEPKTIISDDTRVTEPLQTVVTYATFIEFQKLAAASERKTSDYLRKLVKYAIEKKLTFK